MRLGAIACAAVLTTSCSYRVVTQFELSELGIQYGFAAVFDENELITRFTQPFAIQGDRIAFGATPVLDLEDDEQSFVLIGFDDAILAGEVSGFEPARAGEMTVTQDPPPLSPLLENEDAARPVKKSAVPRGAKFLTANLTAGGLAPLEPIARTVHPAIDERLTLHVPVDPEHCRIPNQTPLAPFGADGFIFSYIPVGPLAGLSPHILQLIYLDDDHLLALTNTHLVISERGSGQSAERMIQLSHTYPEVNPLSGITTSWMALDPIPLAGGRRRVVAVGEDHDTVRGFVWELAVDATGAELVSTTTTAERASSVAILPDGRTYVGFIGATVRSKARNETELGPPRQLERYFFDGTDYIRVRATMDPLAPLIAGSDGRIHRYIAGEDRWLFQELFQDGLVSAEPLQFYGLSADDPLEQWAGAQRGNVYRRRIGEDWQRVMLTYPPRFAGCANIDPMTGRLVFPERLIAVSIATDYVFVNAAECSALIQVRREDGCVSIQERPDIGIARTDTFNQANVSKEGRVAVGGIGGFIYESRWR